MSTVTVEPADVMTHTGYQSPKLLGCNVIITPFYDSAKTLKMELGLHTPMGTFRKTYTISGSVAFPTLQPIRQFKIDLSIKEFAMSTDKKYFTFELVGKAFVKIPMVGWRHVTLSHHFEVPTSPVVQNAEIDDTMFSALLALHVGTEGNDGN